VNEDEEKMKMERLNQQQITITITNTITFSLLCLSGFDHERHVISLLFVESLQTSTEKIDDRRDGLKSVRRLLVLLDL